MPIRLSILLISLLVAFIVILANSHEVSIDLLFAKLDKSLGLVIFVSSLFGAFVFTIVASLLRSHKRLQSKYNAEKLDRMKKNKRNVEMDKKMTSKVRVKTKT